MKIAVTGHTQGLGKSIADWMSSHGHEVTGFSRTTGHDIKHDEALDLIVSECEDVDIFFNNATWEFQQTKLLFKLHEAWSGQHKTIVNISTSYTQRWDHSHVSPMYRTSKCGLNEGCEFLWNKLPWPRIVLVKPCVTETPKAVWYEHPNKVLPDDMADMICNAVMETRCRVQEIAFEVNPRDAVSK